MAASTPDATFACHPNTERGRGILIAGDPKTSHIAYCNGKSVILRSLDDPRQCDVYSEHAYNTTVARFSPNSEWVASGDVSGNVRVWARGGEHKLKYEIRALLGSIDDLQWSADGQRIAVSGDGRSAYVRVFSWDSGGNLGVFEGHSRRVLSCSFRPVRPFRVVTCGEDFSVNYYEGPPFKFKTSTKDHSNFSNCVRFSPDGSRYISVGSDRKGLIFDGSSGQKIGQLEAEGGHTGSIYALSWSPDGKQILTVSADKTAKIWNIAEDGSAGTVATTFDLGLGGSIERMQVGCLWLGPHIITVALNGDIQYLSPANPASPARTLVGHSKFITAAALTTDGPEPELYTGSFDGQIVRWQPGAGPLGRVEPGPKGPKGVKAMAVAAGLLVVAGMDEVVRLCPLPATAFATDTPSFPLGTLPLDISVAADDPHLILVTTVSSLVLIRGSSVLTTTPVSTHFEASAGALSPDGKSAAVGSPDGKIRVVRVGVDGSIDVGAPVLVLERHRGPITAIKYSPDGRWIASADQNRESVVWDAVSGETKLKNMVYHTARISCVDWSPDSSLIATGSLDTCILVYALDKPVSSRSTLRACHKGGITTLAFVDGSTLVSAGDDACIKFWSNLIPPA